MKRLIYICGLITFSLLQTELCSAQNCENSLSSAYQLYQNGKLTECISTLKNCLDSYQNSDERFEAHRLIALSYFGLSQAEQANFHMTALLKERPNYQLLSRANDPVAFAQMIEQFEVQPLWQLNVYAGIQSIRPIILENRLAFPQASSNYQSQMGYEAGMGMIRSLNDRLGIRLAMGALGGSIEHQIQLNESQDQQYNESFDLLDLSIQGLYTLPLSSSWTMELGAGFGAAYFYSSQMFVEFRNAGDPDLIQFSASGLDQRRKFQPSIIFNLGLFKDLVNGSLGIEIGHREFLSSTIATDQAYDQLDFNLDALYVNDILRLRSSSIHITYRVPLSYAIRSGH